LFTFKTTAPKQSDTTSTIQCNFMLKSLSIASANDKLKHYVKKYQNVNKNIPQTGNETFATTKSRI